MLEITHSIDKYVMRERLGWSRTAEVWKAFDQALQRPVMIKVLRTSPQNHASVQRLQQNFALLVSLRHPNIIHIYDILSPNTALRRFEGNSAYVVMPDIAGITLADYRIQCIKKGKKYSELEIAQLFVALGSALDYVHQRGVIHRRIKPTNILLDQQNTTFLMGEPVLMDFGLMSLENAANIEARSSLYTAPEQALGGLVTEQCDIYALGVILYELCTGRHPFADLGQGAEQQLITAILDPIPPSRVNPAISPALEAVMLQSIAREPEERFADVRTMIMMLLQALNVPISPSLCMEYHVPFLELLQEHAQEARNKMHASELIDIQKLFSAENNSVGRAPLSGDPGNREGNDSVGRAPLSGGLGNSSTTIHSQETGIVEDVSIAEAVLGVPGPPLRGARPTFGQLCEYRFIPLSIVPILLIVLMLSGSLEIGQAAQIVGGFPPRQVIGGSLAGTARFSSSGQGDIVAGQGINDEIHVTLTHVSAPIPGKSYYSWLQADVSSSDSGTSSMPLGQVNVLHGAVQFQYEDPQHNDLLATWSRFLITEEDATMLPTAPSLDRTTWVASGEISQKPTPNDLKHYTALDHIRHLLASDSDLNTLHLPGGLSVWFMHSMQRVQDLAGGAEKSFSAKDEALLRNQLVLLLSDIDGKQELANDLPRNVPLLNDGPSTQVGLLQIHANQMPVSYLDHIGSHVNGLVKAPGVTPDQQNIAAIIVPVISIVNDLLRQIRDAVITLIALSPRKILQTSVEPQLMTIAHLANTAMGQGNVQGARWISAELALLATIPVSAQIS